jgi:hypothetical protein
MTAHFDTPKKSKILGAKEFLDYLKTMADKDGKVNVEKLGKGGPQIAKCFGTSRQNVSNVVKEGRARRHFKKGEEKRGGDRRRDAIQIGEQQLSAEIERNNAENNYEGHDHLEAALLYEMDLPTVSTT